MAFEKIKRNLKKLKNAPLETCLRQLLDKMESQQSNIQLQKSVAEKDSKIDKMKKEIETVKGRMDKEE